MDKNIFTCHLACVDLAEIVGFNIFSQIFIELWCPSQNGIRAVLSHRPIYYTSKRIKSSLCVNKIVINNTILNIREKENIS